jgi:L-aminopeptidase/D-esterase-like protein
VKPGPRNLITDVAGLRVGNAEDHRVKTGATVLVADKPFLASVDVMGGAPGSRDTEVLAPDRLVDAIDALVLSGGSAFGLDAASGVTDALRLLGRGFRYADVTVPIVPGAVLFDLRNGGDKAWAENPYRRLGAEALAAAAEDFALGTAGAGVGATTAGLKGGLGSASLVLRTGHTVAALVAANPTATVAVADSPYFWAAPFEIDGEFGGLGPYPGPVPFALSSRIKHDYDEGSAATANTVIAIVATDAILSKAQLKRLAVSAHDGIARAVSPSHTLVDGDLVFSLTTAALPVADPVFDVLHFGHAAAVCLSRAIARAVYLATQAPGDPYPTWRERWGG